MSLQLKVIRFLKIGFFTTGLHRVVHPFSGALITVGHMARLGRYMARLKGRPHVERISFAAQRSVREDLYAIVLRDLGDGPVDYLEFGVFQGRSLKWWVEHLRHPDTRFYGFDTFTGLPEDWGPYKAGDMSTGHHLPDITDPRVTLVKGLFQDSLPGFQERWTGQARKIIHLDADLYTSTLYVLCSLAPRLRAGDILLFDEFAVPDHEFLAFRNFTEAYRIRYEVLGARRNGLFLAVKLL